MSAIIKEPDVLLRPITIDDLDKIMSIEKQVYDYPWTLGIFRDCLRSGYDCWCFTRDNEPIGYAIMSKGAGEAHVLNISIAPDFQQQGHGRRLIEHMIHQAWRYKIELLLLEVRPSNTQAISLYESVGFNEIGRRPNYYPTKTGREDAVIFACVPGI
ncbi:MAG: ribosomal protein S18-alanine N-acetyltransferase [Gammaproteobacteria bacterium]